ncbi:MAG: hypothetical protein ABSC47_00585 [Terracidiphilus sp.]
MRFPRGVVLFLTPVFVLLCWGCGGNGGTPAPSTSVPLDAGNINLIFVVSGDLDYQAAGDINASTANLTNQGLQRSLLMAPFLQKNVLGMNNVTGIYALEPMTHQQTTYGYPDMAATETIEQFALLNQINLSTNTTNTTGEVFYTGNNYPIYVSYALGSVPSGVAEPLSACPNCQGLDFNDLGGDNETLVTGIIDADLPGYYVFSAPWETTHALLENINTFERFHLNLPSGYHGPNYIYAISIPPSGSARLTTYNSNVNPPNTYPVLPPSTMASASCTTSNIPSSITVTVGSGGAVLPAGANTNETLYFVRHAEAHPLGEWSDNGYVGAGQWRALDLPNALLGKISPSQVWSGDISQFTQGTMTTSGEDLWSGIAPALTVEPYAIANDLPYNLVSSFELSDTNAAQLISNFFFTGGRFSNQKVLIGWSYQQIQPTVQALVSSYYPNPPIPLPISLTVPTWSKTDYDSLWTLTLDGAGNLMADFTKCEGIESSSLPPKPPEF